MPAGWHRPLSVLRYVAPGNCEREPMHLHRCSIVPPYILRSIARRGDAADRVRALAALELSLEPRRARQAAAVVAGPLLLARPGKRRTIFDAANSRELPGRRVRSERGRPAGDAAVDEAFEAAGRTYDFYREVLGRKSLDDRGMRLDSTVHYGRAFSNAQWDGAQMIYGDGDGKYFRRFTACLDVVAHELTHGVTQYAAALGYSGQCGALGEHFADVFGVLVKQHASGQRADRADWLVGAGLFTRRVDGRAIRSMKQPGSAYDDPILGRDPQPAHMRDLVEGRADDGGVHVNSGIPNHAFYRVAIALGGHAWEVAGRIWYRALTRELGPRSRFQQCADATWRAALELYGRGSHAEQAVRDGWASVGIEIRGLARPVRQPLPVFEPPAGAAEVPFLA